MYAIFADGPSCASGFAPYQLLAYSSSSTGFEPCCFIRIFLGS